MEQQKIMTEKEVREIALKNGYSEELYQKAKKVGHPIRLEEPVTDKEVADINSRLEFLNFLGLEVCDGNTRFINIDYNNSGQNKREGRTCLALGAFGLHARITGEYEGKTWDEGKAMHLDKETDWDVTISCRREFVFHVMTTRVKQDYSNRSDISPDQIKKMPEYLYTLQITHSEGNIQITGLLEEAAKTFRKMIWTWIIFHNQHVQSAQS